MITGELKASVDRIWDAFGSGGIANPLEVMELITYLLFIRRLDDLQTAKENRANRLRVAIEAPIFPPGADDEGRPYVDLRWSRFKDREPSVMFAVVVDRVFPFLRQIGGDDSTYSHHRRSRRTQHAERPLDTQGRHRINDLGASTQLTARHRASGERLPDRAREVVRVGVRGGDVDQRPGKRRETKARANLHVLRGQIGRVQNQRVVAHPESGRNRQVNARRLELADLVNAERSVMRHDRALLRPQMPASELIVDPGHPLSEAEDATVDADPVPGAHVMGLGGIGVADRLRLSGGEVAGLVRGEREQSAAQVSTIRGYPSLKL